MMENKTRSVKNIVKSIFTWAVVLVAFAVMIFTVFSATMLERNDRDLFGYKAFIVRSDSMKATDFDAGDLIVLKETEPDTLAVGDIIAFRSSNPETYGETFTHKIRSITTTGENVPAFVTYGTTTGVDDEYPVTYEQVQGKYLYTIKGVGKFISFMKSTTGYICCILLPFMVLIIMQAIRSSREFKLYQEEKLAEIEAVRINSLKQVQEEREKLAEERARYEELASRFEKEGLFEESDWDYSKEAQKECQSM